MSPQQLPLVNDICHQYRLPAVFTICHRFVISASGPSHLSAVSAMSPSDLAWVVVMEGWSVSSAEAKGTIKNDDKNKKFKKKSKTHYRSALSVASIASFASFVTVAAVVNVVATVTNANSVSFASSLNCRRCEPEFLLALVNFASIVVVVARGVEAEAGAESQVSRFRIRGWDSH